MFRKMRRFRQQISEDECVKLLQEQPRGVLSVHGEDGYPYGVPMDFIYNRDTGKIYFHCARQGHKLDAIRNDSRVSFCVWDQGAHESDDWSLWFSSVIIFGTVKILDDYDSNLPLLKDLGMKYYPDEDGVEEELKKFAKNALILELTIDHMTGKHVHEK